MARLPRLVVPGYPHHVIQRGNNRQDIFIDDIDRAKYLSLLAESATRHDLPIHAYVLMPNHVHLMVTPSAPESLAAVMQEVGRRFVRVFNLRHGRTGTLFEGRFRSSVIDSDRYALTCIRYIEMNPVRAGLAASPEAFRWSSHRHHVGVAPNPLVSEHSLYWALGNTPFDRQTAFKRMFDAASPEPDIREIRNAIQGGWAVGADDWKRELSQASPRRPTQQPRGRPVSST